MSTYLEKAWEVIDQVHATLPRNATELQRRNALRQAYPFGVRANWPYKAWCKAQRAYLVRWSDKPAGPLDVRPE